MNSIENNKTFPIYFSGNGRIFHSIQELKKYIIEIFANKNTLCPNAFRYSVQDKFAGRLFKIKLPELSFNRKIDCIDSDEFFNSMVNNIFVELLSNYISYFEERIENDLKQLFEQIFKISNFNNQLQKFKIDNSLVPEIYPLIPYNGPR